MTRRKWFRVYHGLASDMSLAVAAEQAQIARTDMIALWLCLLDHASRATPAGSIVQFEKEETALMLGMTSERVEAALRALRTRKKIDAHQRIAGWDKHQPSSTARVRALRARRQNVAAPSTKTRAAPPAGQTRVAQDHDSPAAIAARRARLQQNNALIIGQPARTL